MGKLLFSCWHSDTIKFIRNFELSFSIVWKKLLLAYQLFIVAYEIVWLQICISSMNSFSNFVLISHKI